MNRRALYILPLALFTMCGGADNRESRALESPMAVESKVASFASDQSAAQPVPVTTERKLIKNGDLSFETADVKETKGKVEAICKELKAYISNENQNNYGSRLQYNQIIRVPADQFDVLIQRIEEGALKVESKNINTQDVTEEFIDVEARLKTKKDLEVRYREILKQAKTVQDIMSIEGQISSVRAEIESMEGRLNYLKNQVSFSTLNVSYYQQIGTDFGFGPKVVRAIGDGWDNLLSFLIVLVNLWPFLLLIAAGAWATNRWRKRKKMQSSS